MANSRTLWITKTASLMALLIGLQSVTAFLTQMVTGSLVNLVLIVATVTCGLVSGITIAVVSPIVAKLIGIGPLWEIIPFIIIGNTVIVLVWHFLGRMAFSNKYAVRSVTTVIGAVCKFLTLYVCIVRIAVPLLLQLPEPQAAVVTGLFSFPQLFTALIGGGIAVLILPMLEKVLKSHA